MKKILIQIKMGANLTFQALLGYRSFQIGCVFAENESIPEMLRFEPIPPFIFPLQSL